MSTETNLVSPHEIRKGLKTWEMLKLVEENPGAEVHAKPENQDYQDNDPWLVVKNNDLIGWKNTWTVKIAPKEVTITRAELAKWFDHCMVSQGHLDDHYYNSKSSRFNDLCKRLGL